MLKFVKTHERAVCFAGKRKEVLRCSRERIFSLTSVEILVMIKFGALTHMDKDPKMERIVETAALEIHRLGRKRRGIHVSHFSGGG